MREIKFRALKDDMSDCNWKYGNLIYNDKGEPRIQENCAVNLFTTCIKGTEGQFTGLKDINGTDIYEGDIVKTNSTTTTGKMVITFEDGAFCLRIPKTKRFNGSTTIRDGIGTARTYDKELEIEIIGNIHDNPL